MTNSRWAHLSLALLCMGCETYDPPPQARLVASSGSQYSVDTPVEISFSEPVSSASLAISIWCTGERDEEGHFTEVVDDAVAHRCVPTLCPEVVECGAVSACLETDRMTARLNFESEVCTDDSWQAWIVVEAGLEDDLGNDTGTAAAFSLMLWPSGTGTPTDDASGQADGIGAADTSDVGPVTGPMVLNSGVVTLISSLSDGNEAIAGIYPSLYLRLLVDVAADPDTGTAWLLATVARLSDDAKDRNATSEIPTDREPILDNEGWAVLIMGTVTANSDGSYNLDTIPTDVTVWVLGTIKVVLKDFQLVGRITPGQGDETRDSLAGELKTTEAEITLGAPSPLGAVNAIFTGDGLFSGEVPEDLPRLCSEDPCGALLSQGGDCQLPLPWEVPELCP
jgi:hypothetical protein